MSIFRYKMQSILNLKNKMEEQAKMEFAAARIRLDAEEEKLSAFYIRQGNYESEGRRMRSDSLKVRDILDNRDAILKMDECIKLQKKQVNIAAAELEEERRKMTEAIQERKVHERLREKAFELFMKEENARESKETDELTSYQYTVRKEGEENA